MDEEERSELSEHLEAMPPGPQLATLLASIDRQQLSETDRVRLVQARNRLVSHQQAELLADMYAVCRDETPEFSSEHTSRYPWSEIELAFALRWTRVAAGYRLEQARQLIEDFPAVQAALAAGDIDPPKAYLIADLAGWLDDLPTARQVVDKVIDLAPRLTTGQLRARLRRLILAVDPQAVSKRCASAVTTRRVESLDNPDGTGELWGRSLPPQDTAAAWERLSAIARSAKTAGDGRSVDQLRADALLDLLVGRASRSAVRSGITPPACPAPSPSTNRPHQPNPLPSLRGIRSGRPSPPARPSPGTCRMTRPWRRRPGTAPRCLLLPRWGRRGVGAWICRCR